MLPSLPDISHYSFKGLQQKVRKIEFSLRLTPTASSSKLLRRAYSNIAVGLAGIWHEPIMQALQC